MNEFSKQEKDFFKRLQKNDSKLKRILIGISVLLLFGIFLDALDGFQLLRNSETVFHGIVGIIILLILYLLGEYLGVWINEKDDVTHPLYKRLYHLILLLLSAVIFIVLYILLLRYLYS